MRYLILSILLVFHLNVLAQQAWKCTSLDGSISFQNTPCFGDDSTRQERIKIDPQNSIGRGDTGQKYRTFGSDGIKDQYGNKYRSQGGNWGNDSTPSYQAPSSSTRDNYPDLTGSCQSIEFRLSQIQEKMRSGYSARQGEKLKAERRNLKSSYNSNCR